MEYSKIKTTEKYLFFSVLCLYLIPIFTGKFFPSMDGPAHLYNSQLINSLLFDDLPTLKQYYEFNSEPVPNWTGHLILSFFNLFLPGFVAEKILLLFYLIGLPLAFRSLLKSIGSESYLLSYLIFPFCYSCFTVYGFFNYCLAIVFMLWTLSYWVKHRENLFTLRNSLILFVLILITYFSHIFVFSITVFIIGLYIGVWSIKQLIVKTEMRKSIVKESFRKLLHLLMISGIPLLFFTYYFCSRPSATYQTFQPQDELIKWLTTIAPIIGFDPNTEAPFTSKIFYILITLSLIALIVRVYKHISRKLSIKEFFKTSDFWLLIVLLMLVLYFKLPDANDFGGYVSLRLGFLTFIFFIVWLALQQLPKAICLMAICGVFFFNYQVLDYHNSCTKELNKVALACNNASNYIRKGSVVLPLNYTGGWLFGHFSNYLGADKPMVILGNYECGNYYFPLKWKENSLAIKAGTGPYLENYIATLWKNENDFNSVKIDYVFILGDSKASSPVITSRITENYRLIYKSNICELFELKTASKRSN